MHKRLYKQIRHSLRLECYSHQASVVFKNSVVRICTNTFNTQHSAPFPQCIYVFCMILTIHRNYFSTRYEPTGLCNRHGLLRGRNCNSIHYWDTLRAMAQAACRRPLTREAQFRLQVSPREICGWHSGTDTGFFFEYFGFTLSVSLHLIYTWLLLEGETGEDWEPSKKKFFFGNRGALNRKVRPLFFSSG